MKLLYAEDEIQLSDAVATMLRGYGYEVDAVFDGAEALRMAGENRYDGVILDIMMPKMDGISVLRALRSGGDTTPVLMLTAKSEVADMVEGLDLGANDYLAKPFSIKELTARLRAMLRSYGALAPQEISYADIRADRAEMTLSGGGGTVGLSPREFSMLELLINSRDRGVTRSVFLEKLWGGSGDGGAVDINIAYLRNKLRSVRSLAYIDGGGGEWRIRTYESERI
jgi:DNA-binding response OmpR family regulator